MGLAADLLPDGNHEKTGNVAVTNARDCTNGAVEATLSVMGGKWKPLILYHLSFGTRRFGEISARMPGVSRKVLTEQLKELEADGLIARMQYREVPPRVEYSLTEPGAALTPIFRELAKWGNKYMRSKTGQPPA